MNKDYETYKDYRINPTQEDCKIFICKCDDVKYQVISDNPTNAVKLLKKYKIGKSYSAKWNKKYFISIIENEVDAIKEVI